MIYFGINHVERETGKTKLVGDVESETVFKIAGAITPVPGGVGSMTIACLLNSTLIAACRANGLDVLNLDFDI